MAAKKSAAAKRDGAEGGLFGPAGVAAE